MKTIQVMLKSLLSYLLVSFLCGICFAEPAPIFEAGDNNMFEPLAEQQQQDLPPPPAPEQDGTFVPMQREASRAQPQVQAQPPQVREQNLDAEVVSTQRLTTEQRLRRMEHIVKLMQSSEGVAQIDSLQNEVQSLRAQVEQLTHQLQQVQAQQKTLTSEPNKTSAPIAENNAATAPTPKPFNAEETDTKLTKKPATAKANLSADTTAVSSQPNVAEEQQIYQTAYNLIKAKKFAEAVTTLQTMLKKYPSGQFASNAHYWLGELYGVLGKNDQALSEFNIVVSNYSDSSRVSDAQLKLGLIYSAQFKWPEAKAAFKKVVHRYPGTTSARLAMEQLKQIKQAGH